MWRHAFLMEKGRNVKRVNKNVVTLKAGISSGTLLELLIFYWPKQATWRSRTYWGREVNFFYNFKGNNWIFVKSNLIQYKHLGNLNYFLQPRIISLEFHTYTYPCLAVSPNTSLSLTILILPSSIFEGTFICWHSLTWVINNKIKQFISHPVSVKSCCRK